MLPLTKPVIDPSANDWGTRSHVQTLLLMAATALGIYLCSLLAAPFLPALAWALALAVAQLPRLQLRGVMSIPEPAADFATQRALHLRGVDLRGLPLERRKQALVELLPEEARPGRVRYSQHIVGKGEPLFTRACGLGLEGVISKRRDAAYHSGRHRDWLKVKCGRRQEVVVGGFTAARSGGRAIGALLVGVYDDTGGFHYGGKVGSGLDERGAAAMLARLEPLVIARRAFIEVPPEAGRASFVRPEVVVEVSFSDWTADGRMRHPVFVAVREDRRPRDIRRERAVPVEQVEARASAPVRAAAMRARPAKAAARGPAGRGEAEVEVAGVPISHPDRVLYPAEGIAKQAVAQYYADVARWMLPWVVGRPVSVVRCPEDIEHPCFFQKHLGGAAAEPGLGVAATVAGRRVHVGTAGWLARAGIDTEALDTAAEALASRGRTPALVAVDGALVGLIAVADRPADGAREVVAALRDLGITVMMVTGDRPGTARAVAAELGIAAVVAGVRPEEKARVVADERDRGRTVAMVGDGINDAPALAAAHVGIAVGTGTDIAIAAADVALLRGGIAGLPTALRLARRTLATIRQNLFWAFIYNVLGVPIAAGVLAPWTGWTLSPVLASAAMSLSSVSVLLNSLRLRRFDAVPRAIAGA